MTPAIGPELALAAACCRWPRSASRDEAVRAAAAATIDWERFDGIVMRNRINGLARDALRKAQVAVPEPVDRLLSARADRAVTRGLAMARESVRLQRAFEAEGLPAVIVKGAPLAALAYGELGLRESWDIDLLTTGEAAAAARQVLIRLGYRMPAHRELNDHQFARLVPYAKDAEFNHEQANLTVELHWRLVHSRGLLWGVSVEGPMQEVSLGTVSLPTLAEEPLFAYLCTHCTVHGWNRLKWLADVGAVLANRPPADIERLYEAARSHGAARSAAVALLLCRRMLGLPLSAGLALRLEQDRVARWLEAGALAGLGYGGGTAEHSTYSAPWARQLCGRLLLAPGMTHLTSELLAIWNASPERARSRLPRGLGFLYHLLRVPLWLGRFGKRTMGRTAG